MRRITIKSGIALITFIIGILAVGIWFTRESPDLTVYSVKFCDLIKEPNRYDGKFVRIRATHGGLGIDTPTFIADSDCNEQIRSVCVMNGEDCSQMYMKLRSINFRETTVIDAVGRFTANIKDPSSNSRNPKNVRLFEITELKGIETVKIQ